MVAFYIILIWFLVMLGTIYVLARATTLDRPLIFIVSILWPVVLVVGPIILIVAKIGSLITWLFETGERQRKAGSSWIEYVRVFVYALVFSATIIYLSRLVFEHFYYR